VSAQQGRCSRRRELACCCTAAIMRGCAADLQIGTVCTAQVQTLALLFSQFMESPASASQNTASVCGCPVTTSYAASQTGRQRGGTFGGGQRDALHIRERIRPIKV